MLITDKVAHTRRFEWLSQMRFYFDPKKTDVLQQLSIHMANAQFNYGFEYLGVQDKLVQTPLTDRCYLTMTQALEERLGGSPFGMSHLLHSQTLGAGGGDGLTPYEWRAPFTTKCALAHYAQTLSLGVGPVLYQICHFTLVCLGVEFIYCDKTSTNWTRVGCAAIVRCTFCSLK